MNATVLGLLLLVMLFVAVLGLIFILSSAERDRRKAIERFSSTHGVSAEEAHSWSWTEDGFQLGLTALPRHEPSITVRLKAGSPHTLIMPGSTMDNAGSRLPPTLQEVKMGPQVPTRFFTVNPDYLEHLFQFGLVRHTSSSLPLTIELLPSGVLTVSPAERNMVNSVESLEEMLRVAMSSAQLFSGRFG